MLHHPFIHFPFKAKLSAQIVLMVASQMESQPTFQPRHRRDAGGRGEAKSELSEALDIHFMKSSCSKPI